MVALNVVGRLLQHHDLQTYRRRLAAEITQHQWLRLLPALADLPLEIVDAAGRPCQLHEVLADTPHVTLAGASGGGRQLALLQYALRWAGGAAAEGLPPTLVRLPQIAGMAEPEQALANLLRDIGLPLDARPQHEPRGLFRRSSADQPDPLAHSLLLVHGLDQLEPDAQDGWRLMLQQLGEPESTTQLIVAVDQYEPAWPGFTPLRLAPITPAVLAGWVEHLSPPQQRAGLLAALSPHGALHPLGARLFEIALLAWLAPQAGLPGSRAELYALALAQLLGLPIERLDASSEVAELQLLAAYDERPARMLTALFEPGAAGRLHFHHPQLRRYLAARQLLAEARLELLAELAPVERGELALLLATMPTDSAQLYPLLWQAWQGDDEDILALGRCLRERPPQSPAWVLRIAGALAQIAHDRPEQLASQAAQLLCDCAPLIGAAMTAAGSAGESTQRFLARLLDLLPPDLAGAGALDLVMHDDTPEEFGWQLADRLLQQPALHLPISPRIASSAPMLARWIYLHAVHAAGHRAALDPAGALAATQALARSAAGDTRLLFAATALVEDGALDPAIRAAAMEIIAANRQPNALTIVERACDDPAPSVRRVALTALYRRDPARGEIALGRAALDRAADWELRYAAIQALGTGLTAALVHLLAQCATDARLPLFVRLYVAELIGRHPAGPPELLPLLGRSEQPDTLRATIARALGQARYTPALRDLLRMLDAPAVARTLIEGCCAGLGELGHPDAIEPLMTLTERSYHDPALTIAAVQALGRLGDAQPADLLGRLVGVEALQRLQRGLTPRVIQLPVEDCLDNDAVPPRIIEQLADALANAATPEVCPSTLGEFLAVQADRVRAASAQALATIGGNTARAALLSALLDDAAGGATADVIAALAELEGPESTVLLGYLLEAGEVSQLTRWLVVQRLAAHPQGEELMSHALANPALDHFTRGALAESLGQRRALPALPLLRQIADDRSADAHLRAQAILGLGLMGDPSAEATLLAIAGDSAEDATLRGLAADYLPAPLSAEGCRVLRDLLRDEPPPPQLTIGALRSLGRARDREALPAILRHSQDTAPMIAQAAIDALADLGDASVAPVLVRISQQPQPDHALRLQAVGALLKIGGEGYRPLLRSYLEQGPLPLRLLALEAQIEAGAPIEELHAMLSDPEWPLPLRLRLLEQLAGDAANAPLLCQILDTPGELPQLRALAAEALGLLRWQPAEPALQRQALDGQMLAAIRLRCITALGTLGSNAAWATISGLADDDKQPTAIRNGARAVLRAVAGS